MRVAPPKILMGLQEPLIRGNLGRSRRLARARPVPQAPRPSPRTICAGHWLVGYGIAYHLIETKTPLQRQQLWSARLGEGALCFCPQAESLKARLLVDSTQPTTFQWHALMRGRLRSAVLRTRGVIEPSRQTPR